MVVFTLRGFSPNQGSINPLITKWHLVLLMVVDVSGILDDAKEQWNSIFRQLGAYESRKLRVVKRLTRIWANLNRCTAGTPLVVGETDAVNIGFGDARELA